MSFSEPLPGCFFTKNCSLFSLSEILATFLKANSVPEKFLMKLTSITLPYWEKNSWRSFTGTSVLGKPVTFIA